MGAAILGSIGVVLLLLALLRAIQAHTGSTFTGNLSWIPYLIALAVGTVVTVLAISRIGRGKKV